MAAENTVDKVVDVAWNTSNKGVRLPLPPARCQDVLCGFLILLGGLAVAQKFFDDIPWATIAANAEGDDDY